MSKVAPPVGYLHSYNGPVVLGPPAILRGWRKTYPVSEAQQLRDDDDAIEKKGAGSTEVGVHRALLLHFTYPTRFVPVGKGGVLVRLLEHEDGGDLDDGDPAIAEALYLDLAPCARRRWRKAGSFEVTGDLILFASEAGTQANGDDDEPGRDYWDTTAKVKLAAGRYDVTVLDHRVGERRLQLVALSPAGRALDLASAPRPKLASARRTLPRLETSAAIRAIARAARWVSTDGGPVIVLPREGLRAWRGVAGGHYAEHVIDAHALDLVALGRWSVLVLPGQEPTSFAPTAHGGILVRSEMGADDARFAMAFGAPEDRYAPTDLALVTGRSGALVILDATDDGRAVRRPFTVKVAPGRYAIDATGNWRASVDGKEARVRLVRLRRATSRAR